MYISQHSDFILSPLIKILKDGIAASRAIGDGIDSYPMGEYLMQSFVFENDRCSRTKDEMYMLGTGYA